MIKVLVFYLFLWWFTKLDNKKLLIVRAVFAGALMILFLVGAITVFTEPHMVRDGVAFMGIFALVPAILFGIRLFFDIKKIISIQKNN